MKENDKKIRRQWLGVLILSMSNAIITNLLQLQHSPFPLARYVITVFSLLGTLGFGFAVYHCSYRKPGTKVLTFCLVLTVISLIATPIFYFSGKIQPPAYIPYYGAYALVMQGIGVWWSILCWKMRKINQRLQELSSSPA